MRVRLSQEAVNTAVELGKAVLKKYVENNLLSMNMAGKVITVPPTQFGKEYIIESIDHESVELPDIQMTLIEPNKIRIQVTGGNIKGSVKLQEKDDTSVTGRISMELSEINHDITASPTWADGHLGVALDTCDQASQTQSISFGLEDALDTSEHETFISSMTQSLSTSLCNTIERKLLPMAFRKLMALRKMILDASIKYVGNVTLDMSYTTPPTVHDGHIDASARACAYHIGTGEGECVEESNFNPADLPEDTHAENTFFGLVVADEVQNRLFRVLLDQGILAHPMELPAVLGGDIIAETHKRLIQEGKDYDYQEGDEITVKAHFSAEHPPHVHFMPNEAKLQMRGTLKPIMEVTHKRGDTEISKDTVDVSCIADHTFNIKLDEEGKLAKDKYSLPDFEIETVINEFTISHVGGTTTDFTNIAADFARVMKDILTEKSANLMVEWQHFLKENLEEKTETLKHIGNFMEALTFDNINTHTHEHTASVSETFTVNVEAASDTIIQVTREWTMQRLAAIE